MRVTGNETEMMRLRGFTSPWFSRKVSCLSPIRVDAPDHAVIPGDVEMQGEEFEVGAK